MANSRRNFIKKSAMAVVAAGIPIELSRVVFARSGSEGFSVPSESLNDPLMYLKQSSFEPYVNSIFQVRTTGFTSNLTLRQVGTQSVRTRSAKAGKTATTVVRDPTSEDRFALLFKSTDSLPQGVYNVNHAALGKFRILIVPVINRDTGSYYYEAIINRAVS